GLVPLTRTAYTLPTLRPPTTDSVAARLRWQGCRPMSRPALVGLALILAVPALPAQDPKPDAVERALALQKAMAAARQYLTANQPADAVVVLEAQLGTADGNRVFLALLRDAYVAELKRLELGGSPDPAAVAKV